MQVKGVNNMKNRYILNVRNFPSQVYVYNQGHTALISHRKAKREM